MNHEMEWYNRHYITKQYMATPGNFYMVFIDSERDAKYPCMFSTQSFDWAFSDNEWVFRQFLKEYDCIYSNVDYHIEEFHNVTWDEFENAVRKKHTHAVNLDLFIDSAECEWGEMIYYNEEIWQDYYSCTAEFDVIWEESIYNWFELLELINSGWLVDSPDVRDIREFITRFCKCYAMIYMLMYNWSDAACGDRDSDLWFSYIPDSAKTALTKEANFPMLLEDLGYIEFVDNNYLLYRFIKGECTSLQDDDKHDVDDGSQQLWDRR